MAEPTCIHAVPQAADQLHGICIFCYRDRLGAARAENASLRERVEVVEDALRQLLAGCADTVNPKLAPTWMLALIHHGHCVLAALAAAKPAAQEAKEAP